MSESSPSGIGMRPRSRMLRAGRSAQEAADEAIRLLSARTGGTGGLILLDRHGAPGFAFNTPHMVWGVAGPAEYFRVGV